MDSNSQNDAPQPQSYRFTLAHWVFARLLAGQSLNGQMTLLSAAQRELAERMQASPDLAVRLRIWRRHVDELPRDEGNQLAKQVFAVDPLSPPPESDRGCPEVEDRWPAPPTKDAYYGLAGDCVRAIEPHSEADPVALLIQFLVAFGNLVGRKPHFVAEADLHYLNLYTCLVGRTGKARKGASWGHIKRVMHVVDNVWAEDRIQSGLSSGEGMIHAVRDAATSRQKAKNGDWQTVEVDAGVEDKRLLAFEPEFASVLRTAERKTNTLSVMIRQAWDTGDLRTLTKNSPTKATGAHISIIGHITAEELRRYLTTTEAANGFANRILWTCARRSKLLPEGGQINRVDFGPLLRRLTQAVQAAQNVGEMVRDDGARSLWRSVYADLSEGKPGLLGAVTSRGEAQVMRLASIYAMLDCTHIISEPHLRAAMAVWDYAERSAAYVFGESLGDPLADEIWSKLKQTGCMTRTEIRDLLGRNASADKIGAALATLLEAGLATKHVQRDGPGRPEESWFPRNRQYDKTT